MNIDRRTLITGAVAVAAFAAVPSSERMIGAMRFHSGMTPIHGYDKHCWHTAKGFRYLKPSEPIVPVSLSEWVDVLDAQCGELGYVGWSEVI